MTDDQSKAISDFFACVDRLKQSKVIRSDRYLGDIAEFICKDQFDMVLAVSARQAGHDGHINGQRIQVKYSGGRSTTVEVGDPTAYEELIVLVGPSSALRVGNSQDQFEVYRIPSSEVLEKVPHQDRKRRYTKNQLPTERRLGNAQ